MVIDGEFHHTLRTGVDQTQTVGLARLELELGNTCVWCALGAGGGVLARIVHLAVDEDVVRERWELVLRCWSHDRLDQAEPIRVKPIVDHDRAKVLIVLDVVVGTVDDERTEDTSGELSRVVGVVPSCA